MIRFVRIRTVRQNRKDDRNPSGFIEIDQRSIANCGRRRTDPGSSIVEEEKSPIEIFETREGKVWPGFTVSGSGKKGQPGP
jgi:hypothetical protein